MERILSEGIIYKISKYADNSAIASAYTLDYGKIKLFMPKAYSSKGGVQTFIPGEIDFLKKDTSELNKFYNFRPDTTYIEYASTPAISLRLSLYFDIFDKFYELEQADTVIWTIIKKYKTSDYSKINLFSIYALLKNTGHMFNFNICSSCGAKIEEQGALNNGLYYCNKCAPENSFYTESYVNTILRAFSNQELYKNIRMNKYDELSVLDLFAYHIEQITGSLLKSYKLFKELIITI